MIFFCKLRGPDSNQIKSSAKVILDQTNPKAPNEELTPYFWVFSALYRPPAKPASFLFQLCHCHYQLGSPHPVLLLQALRSSHDCILVSAMKNADNFTDSSSPKLSV